MQMESSQSQAYFLAPQIFYPYTKYHHHSSSPLSINFCFLFYAYIISRHIGNWIYTKNEENEKKVVAKVVDFPDFDIYSLGNRMSNWNKIFNSEFCSPGPAT